MTLEQEILEFINRRWSKDADWTNGNCYYFAKILKARFPQLDIYYCQIDGHFISGHNGEYFDWNGKYIPQETPVLFDDLEDIDRLLFSRIIRDCVL